MDRCEECGFTYDDIDAAEVPQRLRGFAERYAAALGERADVRRRPEPDVWSPLEYACHFRDVLRVQAERLDLALHHDAPVFVSMGREELVISAAYNRQDPQAVTEAIDAAAALLATAFTALGPQELARVGLYPWPEPTERTMLWLGRHTVHEGEHHLMDIRRMP